MSGCLRAPYLWEVKRHSKGFCSWPDAWPRALARGHTAGKNKGKWLKKRKEKKRKKETLQHPVFNLNLQGLSQSDATHYWWNVRIRVFFSFPRLSKKETKGRRENPE